MASDAAARCLKGGKWRGHALEVRRVKGRGGKNGLRYKVALTSLPTELQEAFRISSSASNAALVPWTGDHRQRIDNEEEDQRARELFEKIKDATGHATDRARNEAVDRVHERTGIPLSTLRRHVKNYDAFGLDGLKRKKPANAGQKRCHISRAFDKAFVKAGHPPEALPELSRFVDKKIAGLWKGRAYENGENVIAELVAFLLYKECQDRGLSMSKDHCVIGRNRVRELRYFKRAAVWKYDAREHRNQNPCVRRVMTGLEPMELVVADVKHLDVLFEDIDGRKTYPKLIGFMDAGTQRIYATLVLCEKRKSITQKLVIEGFIAMCRNPLWGLPKTLYLDNGSEFGGLDKLSPAITRLNNDVGNKLIDLCTYGSYADFAKIDVKHAQPYNAQAKPIEGLFRRLDQYCFSSMKGYTGPNRTNKKTENDGREAEAWSGSWDDFSHTVWGLIEYFHQKKIGGQWDNRSPNQIFQAKLDEGWRPDEAPDLSLELAFSTRRFVSLRQNSITYRRKKYWHDELNRLPGVEKLELFDPWFEGANPVAILPSGRALQLTEDISYHPTDKAGAQEATRRKRVSLHAIRQLDSEVEELDPTAIKLQMAAEADRPIVPGQPRFLPQSAKILQHPTARLIEASTAEGPSEAELRRREMEEHIALTEKGLGRKF
ncbi:MAG: hypothetical protein V2I27_03640 [Erythrobacter sp.]|nr:hypothetical protein [Erythrobacter sp.]